MYLRNTAFHEKDRTARSCSIFFIRTPLGGDCHLSAAFSTLLRWTVTVSTLSSAIAMNELLRVSALQYAAAS